MFELTRKLWRDDSGALIATEWVFVATILVLGVTAGLVAVNKGVLAELVDLTAGVTSLNQSYSYSGSSNCHASMAGSSWTDAVDSLPHTGNVPANSTNPTIGAICD